jgi:hypothetical protein
MPPPKKGKYSSDRRERMKELQAEGKMTPEHGKLGGRPRKGASDSQPRRASAVIAEYAREHSDEIAKVLSDVLNDPDASDGMKLRATKLALRIETDEEKRRREDERDGRAPEPPDTGDRAEVESALDRALSNPIVRRRFVALLSAPGSDTAN